MRKILCLLLVSLFTFNLNACASTPLKAKEPEQVPKAKTQEEIISHIKSSSVSLVMKNEDNEIQAYCSGVFISEKLILTANHCVKDDDPKAKTIGNKVYYVLENEVEEDIDEPTATHLAKVLATDEAHDLALLKIAAHTPPAHDIAVLADTVPHMGEKVLYMGSPAGLYFSFGQGTIAGIRNFPKERGKVIQVNSNVYFGNSGCGIFSVDGKLIGIADSIIRGSGIAFCIHLDSINHFIKNKI